MDIIEKLLDPKIIWVVIPVIAILGGIGKSISSRYFDHQERMAKIEAGIDPDRIEANYETGRIDRGSD